MDYQFQCLVFGVNSHPASQSFLQHDQKQITQFKVWVYRQFQTMKETKLVLLEDDVPVQSSGHFVQQALITALKYIDAGCSLQLFVFTGYSNHFFDSLSHLIVTADLLDRTTNHIKFFSQSILLTDFSINGHHQLLSSYPEKDSIYSEFIMALLQTCHSNAKESTLT